MSTHYTGCYVQNRRSDCAPGFAGSPFESCVFDKSLCSLGWDRRACGGGHMCAPRMPCAPCTQCGNGFFYRVSFDTNGGAPVPAPQTVPRGGLATRPADPVRAGYGFAGWYEAQDFSGSPWNFAASPVTHDMVLYAKWEPVLCLVAFDANGGTPIPAPQMVPYRGMATRPADPVWEGHTFVGWYAAADFSGSPWNFENDVVTGDMVLHARWSPDTFLVTFDAGGGVPVPQPQMVPYGGLVARPADPARVGYTFAGWYTSPGFSGGIWNFDEDTVTGNMTLFARWAPIFFTVTFDTNGGTPVPSAQTVEYGGLVTRPTDPIREDFVFIAWYPTPALIGNPWVFVSNTVTENMTLYARWLDPA